MCSHKTLLSIKKVWVPKWSSFCAQLWMFFIWCRRTPLDEPCMALQTFWLMSIQVCTSRLAFMRCPPSILKKKGLVDVFLHFSPQILSLYKRGLVLLSRSKLLLILLCLLFLLWHSWKTLLIRVCECWIDPNVSSSIQCLDDYEALGHQQWIS